MCNPISIPSPHPTPLFFISSNYLLEHNGWGLMIFHFSIVQLHFVFGQINLIVPLPYLIKYLILFIIIVFWLGIDRPVRLSFLSYPVYFFSSSHLSSYLLFPIVLFHSCCSHARVFGKTLVHEFPISCIHSERMRIVFFRQCIYKCTMCIWSEKVEILKH